MEIPVHRAATSISACALIACVIMVFPFWLKIRARNIPLITTLGSWMLYWFLRGINALIWRTDDLNTLWRGRGFCDVEVELFIAVAVSTSSGLLCLFRQLSRSMKTSRLGVTPSKMQKRRTMIFEVFFCLVLPILSLPAAFIVQPVRYAVGPVAGCVFVYEQTLEAYFLYLLWPVVISLIALIYATLALVRVIKHYRELLLMFSELPQGSRMRNEIIKTYIFAFILYLVRTPYMIFTLVTRNKAVNIRPFSWSRIHPSDWLERIWVLYLVSDEEVVFGFTSVLFALLALGCFGTGQDARDELKLWRSRMQDVWKRICQDKRKVEG